MEPLSGVGHDAFLLLDGARQLFDLDVGQLVEVGEGAVDDQVVALTPAPGMLGRAQVPREPAEARPRSLIGKDFGE